MNEIMTERNEWKVRVDDSSNVNVDGVVMSCSNV